MPFKPFNRKRKTGLLNMSLLITKCAGCLHWQAITTASSMELGWLEAIIAGPLSVCREKPQVIFFLKKNNKLHRASHFML
ncbi:MAG TPA: hypothetical protein PLL71_12075 [Agriterribacter sp.]|nr:hypothetical protein [Agriterribacter sp.]